MVFFLLVVVFIALVYIGGMMTRNNESRETDPDGRDMLGVIILVVGGPILLGFVISLLSC